jgi:hypothetical protein
MKPTRQQRRKGEATVVTEDIVLVKLTARGEELGGVTIAGGDYQYDFAPGGHGLRLTRAEFEARCLRAAAPDGSPLLEIAQTGQES